MVDIVSLVKGDSAANLSVTLVREDNGTAFSMAGGTTAVLRVRKKGTTTLVGTPVTVASEPTSNFSQGKLVFELGGASTFLNASNDVGGPGYYEGEVEITFTDSTTQTVFETIPFRVRDEFG